MTAPFGEITYDNPTGATDQSASAGQSSNGSGADAQVETFDLNDPRLVSETIEVNPAADAYAQPPTLPDGKWRAKLRAQDVKGPGGQPAPCTARKDKESKLYLFTALEAEILDLSNPLYDGIKLQDYFVDTQVGKSGGSRVSTIMNVLGDPIVGPTTHRQSIDRLREKLAGEPEIGIETQWEATCSTCEEVAKSKGERKPRALRGMHNFPQINQKNPLTGKLEVANQNFVICPVDKAHGPMYARPRINRYLPLAELGKK